MNKQIEAITYDKPETKKPNYTVRRGVAIAGIALAGLGITKGIELTGSTVENLTRETYIDSEVISIPQDGNIISSAQEAVRDMAIENSLDLSKISLDQVIYQSQSVADSDKRVTQPGDSFIVTLSEVTSGYKISVDPAGLPSLTK